MLLFLLLYLFGFLLFSLYLKFLVLLDDLIILNAIIPDNQSLIFFVPSHFILDLLHLFFYFFFDLFDLFVLLPDLFSLYFLSLVVEGVELQEIELVSCSHLGEFVDRFEVLCLFSLDFEELVQGAACFLNPSLDFAEVLQLELEIR